MMKVLLWMFCYKLVIHPIKSFVVVVIFAITIWMIINVSLPSGMMIISFFIISIYVCKWFIWLLNDEARDMGYKKFWLCRKKKEQRDCEKYCVYHILKQHLTKYPNLDISESDIQDVINELSMSDMK